MSISTTSTKISYEGNASDAPYPIPFKYLEDSHISVYIDGVLQQEGNGADYVISVDGITTTTPQADTKTITIVLDVPFDQPVALQETGVLSSSTLEEAYDRLNMQIRRVWRKAQSVLTFSTDEGGTASTGTADTLLGFDDAGDLGEIPNSKFCETANNLSDVTAATARTNLDVDQAGTDNSTDVTLTGTGTYISIAGQVITVDPITESDVSDLGSYIENVTGEPLSDLSDVTITTPASGEVLKWDGVAWINQTLAEAGIADAVHTHTASEVSDFDTEVGNHPDVTANTSARHDAVTKAGTGTHVSLSGQEITVDPIQDGDVDSEASTSDKVLKSDGASGATWGNVDASELSSTGETGGSKFLREDGDGTCSWVDLSGSGTGDALIANPLSQFASTTSAQLAGTISDETGTGSLVFGTSPALTTPDLGTPSAVDLENATLNGGSVGVVQGTDGTYNIEATSEGAFTSVTARGEESVDLQLERNSGDQVAEGANSALVAGKNNKAVGIGSAVVGGTGNTATGNYSFVTGSTNTVTSGRGFVGGGINNDITSTGVNNAVIGGGDNDITGTQANGFIGGGQGNEVSGVNAVVLGGLGNTASGGDSLAAGDGATASHNGARVFGDSTATDIASQQADEFCVQTSSMRIVTAEAGAGKVLTCSDADGNSTWQDPSVGVSEIEDISSMRVIGNVTGSTATPTEVVVVRETDSIESNDNDTTIPTSAAVKDYVDSNSQGVVMVQTVKTDLLTHAGTTGSTWQEIISATITPRYTNSKFLITASISSSSNNGNYGWWYKLRLDGSDVAGSLGDVATNRIQTSFNAPYNTNYAGTQTSYTYLDTPSLSDLTPITYSIVGDLISTVTGYINQAYLDGTNTPRSTTTLTIQEVLV